MANSVEWELATEVAFRRDVLLNAPEKAAHLAPWPAADWLAAMSIRELAPPAVKRYEGPERRGVM